MHADTDTGRLAMGMKPDREEILSRTGAGDHLMSLIIGDEYYSEYES
jgi:hypothetical protein